MKVVQSPWAKFVRPAVLPMLAAWAWVHLMPAGNAVAADTESVQAVSPARTPEGLNSSDWASIRAAHFAWQYRFVPTGEGWRARNGAQQWSTTFDGRGFLTEPKAGGWTWGLELKSYGAGQAQKPVTCRAQAEASGQRLTYAWDADLQEWWVNDQRGMEHGYTLKQRPERAAGGDREELLSLTLETRGSLTPKVAPGAMGVWFQDEKETTVVDYAGLKVWDAEGRVLTSRFEPAGDRQVRLVVDDRAARYPITIDPIAQQAYVKPAAVGTTQVHDTFGWEVAVSGDTVVVGAPWESSRSTGINSTPNDDGVQDGAAYVFVRSDGTWTQEAYLKPAAVGAGQDEDEFGFSVAISGDTIVIGAPWENSGTTGVNSTPNEDVEYAGAAYVFVRSAGVWNQEAYLKPGTTPQVLDNFGLSVAVSGDTVVIGAGGEDSGSTGVNSVPDESAPDAGAAYVFVRSGGLWSQQAYLKPAQVGVTQAGDNFGRAVAVSGDRIAVAAPWENSSTTGIDSTPNEGAIDSGAAYVFARSGSTWSQEAYLKPAAVGGTQENDTFGWASIGISGDTVVVGAMGEDSSTTGVNSTPNESAGDSGAAYVFVRSGGVWSQQAYLKPAEVGASQAGDGFGYSVAVSGNLLVIGAPSEASNTTGINSTPNEDEFAPGAAYVFVRSGSAWSQQAYLKPAQYGASQNADLFGYSVAVSGDTVVVGAVGECSSTTGINSSPNEGAVDAGAAYIFAGLGGAGTPEMDVSGNGQSIANGDSTPASADHTDFGNLNMTGASVARTFTVHNSGDAPLSLTGSPRVSLSGAGAFSVTQQPASATVAGGGGAVTFEITFDPLTWGRVSAVVSIANDDGDENPYAFTITGAGYDPNDTLNPTLVVTAPTTATSLSAVSPYLAKGTAGDARGLDRVELVLNGGGPITATLGTPTTPTSMPWSAPIVPAAGANHLVITAYDLRGNSKSITRDFTFTQRYSLTVARTAPGGVTLDGAGTVTLVGTPAGTASALSPVTANANPRTSAVLPGTTIKLTAVPKTGYVFNYWTGVPYGATDLGNALVFTMPAGDVGPITASYVANPFGAPTGQSNLFYGILRNTDSGSASVASEGFLSGTLIPANGIFSGKVAIDGLTKSFVAYFYGSGTATFNAAHDATLVFNDKELDLAFGDAGIQATVTTGGMGGETSIGTAKRGIYSASGKVPGSLLNQKAPATAPSNNKGYFTVGLPAKDQTPPRDPATYPQGDGYATATLSDNGTLIVIGTLADGRTFSCSTGLVASPGGGNPGTAPFLAQLITPGAAATVKGGALLGELVFDPAQPDTDVSGTDIAWYRPAVTEVSSPPAAAAATALYTDGWPNGIYVDAAGALYDKTVTVQAALGLPAADPVNGNAQLVFTLGKLVSSVTKSRFNIADSKATKIPANDASYTLTLIPTTGAFSGTFAPNWMNPNTVKPAFKGLLFQKGGNKGGFGFFLSNAKNDADPESGSATLGAQE